MQESPGKTFGVKQNDQFLKTSMDIPGPGQYSPNKQDRTFAFSMGTWYKLLESKINEYVPGPGNYDVKGNNKPPQYKFGSGGR
jgi:hypothetical protein